jgi:hypothetical protein
MQTAKQIISAQELARNVIKAYEMADALITGVEFHNSENGRSKHRLNINGVLEVRLYMHYECMTPAVYNIYIQIYDNKWSLTTHGYLDEVNVEYSSATTGIDYDYQDLREWVNNFVFTVYQLKVAEVHGIVAD